LTGISARALRLAEVPWLPEKPIAKLASVLALFVPPRWRLTQGSGSTVVFAHLCNENQSRHFSNRVQAQPSSPYPTAEISSALLCRLDSWQIFQEAHMPHTQLLGLDKALLRLATLA
jgi:hypothetical protein